MLILSRRHVLKCAAATAALTAAPGFSLSQVHARDLLPEPAKGEDGLHKPSWLKESFLDITEDIQEAADAGKRLFMTIEWKGCSFCAKMNEVNWREPRIAEYLNAHFDHIQLNMQGAREVTDANGDAMPEKDYIRRLRLRGTPKLVFFHPPEKAKGKRGVDAVAFTTEGYVGRGHFYNMMEYVVAGAYESEPNFFKWLQSDAPKTKIDFD